jgi:hypothetical protein
MAPAEEIRDLMARLSIIQRTLHNILGFDEIYSPDAQATVGRYAMGANLPGRPTVACASG